MTTSLAQQLKKLALPQSSIYKHEKKKASLLFEPKEAASIDRETFYEIGLSGLTELKKINPSFSIYETSLFDVSSKEFERAMQTKDSNDRLNVIIRSFLLKLSPYFLLKPAHKALEWLINRYQIHRYNKDDIFSLILPYHETKIFIRFLQILKIDNDSDFWNWLAPLQKPGIPLAKIVLYNHCVSNMAFIKFLTDMLKSTVKEFGEKAEILTTLFTFYCSTIVGALENTNKITEPILVSVLPGVMECLSSPLIDLRVTGYMITIQIVTKTQLNKKIAEHLVNKIFLLDTDLHNEAVLLLNLMFETQESINTVSKKSLSNLTPNHIKIFCANLGILINNQINITKLLLAFMRGVLPLIQKDSEYFKIFSKLPEILLSEININSITAEKLIMCVIECYLPDNTDKIQDNYDSDIEMVVDDNDASSTSDIQVWYSSFMKNIEQKYPAEFDKVIRTVLNSGTEGGNTNVSSLNSILGFAPKIMKKLGDSFLFEKLYHHNSNIRIEAVKYLITDFKVLLKADKKFLAESIMDRLNDENPDVVITVMSIDTNKIIDLISRDQYVDKLKNVINKGQLYTEWWHCACKALDIVCSFETNDLDYSVYFSIVPYFFPTTKKAVKITRSVLQSPLGQFLIGDDDIHVLNLTDPAEVCNVTYQLIQRNKYLLKRTEIMNTLNSLPNDDYVSIFFSFVLLSFNAFEEISATDRIKLLQDILKYLQKLQMVSIDHQFTSLTLIPFINSSKAKKFPIECIINYFDNLITSANIPTTLNSWMDFYEENPTNELILQIYEFALNDHFKKFKKFRIHVLQLLLKNGFITAEKKIDLFANIVIGYQSALKNRSDENIYLNRSIKILHALVDQCQHPENVLDSNILISAILISLNSTDLTIRSIGLQMITSMLKNIKTTDHHCYIFLKELNSREEELSIDNNQLSLIIYMLLSPDPSIRKILEKPLHVPMKLSMRSLLDTIVDKSTPNHVRRVLNDILTHINSAEIISSLSSMSLDILTEGNNKIDFHKSQLIANIISRIDPSVPYIQDEFIWKLIETGLKRSDITLLDENNDFQPISVLILQIIDNDFFKILPLNKAHNIISLILEAGTYGINSQIISAASKAVKKIELDAKHILNILKSMVCVCEENMEMNLKKKKSTSLSLVLIDSKEWKLGTTLLEYIQDKKKLSGFEDLLPVLFSILKKCLDFEEQSAMEYVKQLLLTSILHCCQRICPITDDVPNNSFKGAVDIELIVLCIRNTQNPQTHHHALMLLSHIAYMFPDQVLQYMMAIFTFIGSSVLRQDDSYSFQIITKIIETVIPILVKSGNRKSDQSKEDLESSVIPILRIFVDAVLDIPEHRRLPLLKKLLITLNANDFLWIFLALMFESHVIHGIHEKSNEHKHRLSGKQEPVRRLDYAMALIMEFPAEIIMGNCNKLIAYIKTLPDEKPENAKTDDVTPSIIFSVSNHSAKHLRHFKYSIITFVNNVLSSPIFIQSVNVVQEQDVMEQQYRSFIVNILTYIQRVAKITDQNIGQAQAKYWKVMLHHCYEVLDNINNLLSAEMFSTVIRGLMSHDLSTVKRKAMEVLNTKLQHNPSFFTTCDNNLVFSLLDPILNIIEHIENDESNDISEGINKQELELNQQTALLSLKLLVRLLCQDSPEKFKPILSLITDLTKSSTVSGNLMASIVLCLAELCGNLKANAIGSLPKFMPSIIKILKNQSSENTPDIILLSVITAVYKIMETIPLFLSPYLEKLLYHFSILSAKYDKTDTVASPISAKLSMIKNKISTTIPPRVLIPIISQSYNLLLKKGSYDAIGPAMTVLADSFAGVSGPEFLSLQNDLTNFFLLALQFRCDHIDNSAISLEQIDTIEGHIITALVALVLKLSESSFRPLYFKIYDWSIRDNDNKERAITFYRLSSQIANSLRGLFILFAGHFIKNAADLLNECNLTKTVELYYESEDKCCVLIGHILNTLTAVFTYDSQNFVNKDRFETIMQPLVDQLDNNVGGIDSLNKRARDTIIPCVTQFSIATADDSLWKPLNYQILLKTRHNDSNIRMIGLECMREMATKLGDSWLPLLPESVPFLAELLEDDVQAVEAATQKAIQTLEAVLGEPLQKYF